MENNAWISEINMNEVFTFDHTAQYVGLWRQLSHVQLAHGVDDDMVWNFTSNGHYTSASVNKAQFIGAASTNINGMVSNVGAPRR
jgi:hypothetical protein